MIFRRFRRPRDPHAGPPLRLRGTLRGAPEDRPGAGDLVIGAISGYGFEDIECWVNSLDSSGFSGDRIVIVYSADFDTVDELVDRGYVVVTYAEEGRRRRFSYPVKGFRHEDVSIDRFYQVWRLLQTVPADYRFVIPVDVRDVVFQRDPSAWLEENLGEKQINVGSEGILVADEPWNSEVLLESYGRPVHEHVASRTACNAGTIAGRSGAIGDLALNVFLCSRLNRTSYTDQAALNVLLSLEPYGSITRFNAAGDDWACQAATMADPDYRAARGSKVVAAPPVLEGDEVRTPSGGLYCLVHQYDRIEAWKERLQGRYADRAPGH